MTISAAVEYHIAGKADDWRYAQAEALGEIVERKLPSVKVVRHCIHPEEWNDYLRKTVNTYGFTNWTKSPLIWTSNGRLIGDESKFITLVESKYNLVDTKSARQLMEIAKENLQLAVRKRAEHSLGRLLVIHRFGEATQVVQLSTRRAPTAKPDQAIVHMLLAPVHTEDLDAIAGKERRVEWVRHSLCPATPGLEGVGVVAEVGSDVKAVSVGQRVYVNSERCLDPAQGTWATVIVCDAQQLLAVPPELSDEHAAVYLATPLKAFGILTALAAQPGEILLVTNGESASGGLIIQMAKLHGMRVIAGYRNQAAVPRLKAHGADMTLHVPTQDLLMHCLEFSHHAGIDKVVDTYGGTIAEQALLALKDGGISLSYSRQPEPYSKERAKGKAYTLLDYHRVMWSAHPSVLDAIAGKHAGLYAAAVEQIQAWVASGQLSLPPVSKKFDLDNIHEVLEHMRDPARTGKPLLVLPMPTVVFEPNYSLSKQLG